MTEPRTKAGRALLDEGAFTHETMLPRILAIEAEAVAPWREVLAHLEKIGFFGPPEQPTGCPKCLKARALLAPEGSERAAVDDYLLYGTRDERPHPALDGSNPSPPFAPEGSEP